ncbi:putative disease resistance RPP13-like protein 1 [Rutidosis leptorrhynchoides]|uniref:putative disease resistance RPP13-like protein 1 n=1 Tax=Rutidosis leptorrhynchoides TaxID=125765 RepID=UPI003A991C8C
MDEMIIGAVVSELIKNPMSVDLIKLARYEGIDSQLNKWTENLTLIQHVLADASQKHITQKAVESWLYSLRELAYDIDDVFDDMATEVIKRKLNQEPHATSSTSSKLLNFFPACCTNFNPHNMIYGRNMSSTLDEITNRLNDLAKKKNNLGLLDLNVKVENSSMRKSVQFQQTSLVDKSTVMGREADTEVLLAKLLEPEAANRKVSLMSIVGMGGIGKTTLAKLLYNDERVNDYFELRAWVCVSEEFDVFSISKAIYQAVAGDDKAFSNLDLIHVALKEKLSKKKFLVVLDDVWNEDHNQWELLKSPFVVGSPGSKIIVTTRKNKVSLVMDSVHSYNLEVLSDEIALSLFAYNALNEENFDNYPSLKVIAHGIIKKCHGLPLALVALGRVLKIKGTSDDEWQELMNSDIWDIEDGSGILPALKLSYYDLPLHLKRLFAYCSLFPKGYKFNKFELVLLWMAEGFLSQSKGNNTMESLGCQYFEELHSRSLFQHSEFLYTMHDLMNDLAVSVAGDFFFMLDDKRDVNGRTEAFEKFRHFSFIGERHAEYRKFKELHRSKRLRTFLPTSITLWKKFDTLDNFMVEFIPKLQFLRVLSLTRSITKVPQSVSSLKHLRYLNFSGTNIDVVRALSNIKKVPEEVSELYNLQSFLVHDCKMLYRLPVSFSKLINLRHLDMSETPSLNKMPLGIGGLSSLQTLSKFIVDGANGLKVSDLKGLLNLQGALSIEGLENVTDPQQANDANLQEKKGLIRLDMKWSDVFNNSEKSMIEYEVIHRLNPHTNLEILRIFRYGGTKFPSWVGDPSFDKLVELTIEGCRNCTHFLNISFPSLEKLNIFEMEGLEKWSCNGDNGKPTGSFPNLREICIVSCPKLVEVSIGLMPSLEVLFISCCGEEVLRAVVVASSTIRRLEMFEIKNLTKLDGEFLEHLGVVEHLKIEACEELRYLWDSESEASRFLVKLQTLDVIKCKNLVSIGEKEVDVGSSNIEFVIRDVKLWICDSLESYNCPNSVENLKILQCSSMNSLTLSTTLHELPSSIKFLEISDCMNLKSFPHEHLQSLESLEEVEIYNCPTMDVRCGLWPPSLRVLIIGRLTTLSEWGPQNYPTSLVELDLDGSDSGVTSFVVEGNEMNVESTSFFLPPSLTYLCISSFDDVELISEVVSHLTHLQELEIYYCPNIKDVPCSTSSLTVTVNGSKR